MITDIAQKLLSSFNGEQPCNNNMFLDYNQTVSIILDIICDSIKVPKLESELEFKTGFSKESLRPIAKNFLLHKNTNLFHKLHTKSEEALTTDFLVDNTGKIHIVIPHLSFFAAPLECSKDNLNEQKQFEKKVLKPYSKQLAKGKPLTQSSMQKLEKNIHKLLPPTNDNSNLNELYSKYIVETILANPSFIQNTIQNAENKPTLLNIFSRFNKSGSICQTLKQEFLSNKFNRSNIPNSFNNVRELYYASRTTLSALSVELHSLSPENFEKHMISLNDSLLQETGWQTLHYKPGQYREHTVKVGEKLLVLLGDRGHVEGLDPQSKERATKAMKPLSEDSISLAQNANNIPLDEYIKQVSLIHFRYINIHPFTNGNGRTGRLLINMLLKEKGMLFNIENKAFKDEYIKVMNSVEQGILKNMTTKEYLTNLYTNPDANKIAEEESIGSLSDFITAHSFTPGDNPNDSRTRTPALQIEDINADPDLSPEL